MNKLDGLLTAPNMVAYIEDDGLVFFDDRKDMYDHVGEEMEKAPSVSTRASGVDQAYPEFGEDYIAWATLWDDDNYEDRYVSLPIKTDGQRYDIPNLKSSDGFNDKCTSFRIQYNQAHAGAQNKMAVLVCYENDTYNQKNNGFAIYATAYSAHSIRYFPNLKSILKRVAWHGPHTKANDSWNDRISSLKFYVTSYGDWPAKDAMIQNN